MKRLIWLLCTTALITTLAYGQSNPFVVGSGTQKTTQGSSYTGAPLYEQSYFGFNGLWNGTGWKFDTDGEHNGGGIVTADPFGGLRFLLVPTTNPGTSAQTISDTQIGTYTLMSLGPYSVQISNATTTGLTVTTEHTFPYGYGILSYVSQPYTKGLAVQLDLGNGNFVENFKVYGNGQVYAREINVMSGNFPDYVFQPGYPLTPLDTLRSYIDRNKHLPGLPSAADVGAQGLNLGQTQTKLVEKIEELTLYLLEQQKRIEALEKKLDAATSGEHK